MTSKLGFVARVWYYFRIGYSTYLTFVLGAANTLVVVWYLAIREVPAIENFFGHFVPFAILTTLVGVPLGSLSDGCTSSEAQPTAPSRTSV